MKGKSHFLNVLTGWGVEKTFRMLAIALFKAAGICAVQQKLPARRLPLWRRPRRTQQQPA